MKLPVPQCVCVCVCVCVCACLVMSKSLRLHGLWPIRLLCPWKLFRQEYWSGLSFPTPGESS